MFARCLPITLMDHLRHLHDVRDRCYLPLLADMTSCFTIEKVVGRRYVLELSLRLLVVRMQIRMEFACQFLEGVLDLLVGRRSIYAEDIVRVLHAPDPI